MQIKTDPKEEMVLGTIYNYASGKTPWEPTSLVRKILTYSLAPVIKTINQAQANSAMGLIKIPKDISGI